MFPAAMSNSTSLSEEASVSSGTRVQDFGGLNPVLSTLSPQHPQKMKKKRNLPGNPDPDAEVIALSPKALMATNRFLCEICNKGFQRDQNLQLHRRGHNLPWKLKQRSSKEVRKRAYVCPEPSCVHHHPSRALGDLTGIKKHYCRKHGEKKWKCEKCSKIYAVQSDWKAHSKTCGTREYRCDCGTLFSRKDSFITHRAFCDALAEESARLTANQIGSTNQLAELAHHHHHFQQPAPPHISSPFFQDHQHHPKAALIPSPTFQAALRVNTSNPATSAHLSATALLQKAATVGAAACSAAQQGESVGHMTTTRCFDQVSHISTTEYNMGGFRAGELAKWHNTDHLTRDFLGLTDTNGADHADHHHHVGGVNASVNFKDMLTFTGGVHFQQPYHDRDQSLLKPHGFGFAESASETWGDC
ncbi:hypothetical protein SLA2020_379300 [Shorea laevis]